MRLWSLHPALLDRAALVAGWREGLLAQAVLRGRTAGYRHHPQLDRFKACPDPVGAVAAYLAALADEADRRGYRFDRARLAEASDPTLTLGVTAGQLGFEVEHLRAKVAQRAPDWVPQLACVRPHPLFHVVPGDIEPWERGHGSGGAPGSLSVSERYR